jgi:hypothetical protein
MKGLLVVVVLDVNDDDDNDTMMMILVFKGQGFFQISGLQPSIYTLLVCI